MRKPSYKFPCAAGRRPELQGSTPLLRARAGAHTWRQCTLPVWHRSCTKRPGCLRAICRGQQGSGESLEATAVAALCTIGTKQDCSGRPSVSRRLIAPRSVSQPWIGILVALWRAQGTAAPTVFCHRSGLDPLMLYWLAMGIWLRAIICAFWIVRHRICYCLLSPCGATTTPLEHNIL